MLNLSGARSLGYAYGWVRKDRQCVFQEDQPLAVYQRGQGRAILSSKLELPTIERKAEDATEIDQ
jgi:hypothetical protein